MVELMCLCMYVCPYTGEFLGGPIFVAFMGIMLLSMKIRPMKIIVSRLYK